MSDDRQPLDLEEQITRIHRARIESDKFQAEVRKLMAESAKLDKERWWFPYLQAITAIAAIIAAAGVIWHK